MIVSQTDDVIKKEETSELTLPYTLVGPPGYTRPCPPSCTLLENRLYMNILRFTQNCQCCALVSLHYLFKTFIKLLRNSQLPN